MTKTPTPEQIEEIRQSLFGKPMYSEADLAEMRENGAARRAAETAELEKAWRKRLAERGQS